MPRVLNITCKLSGAEQFGKLPEHWKVQRLRNVASIRFSNVDKHSKDDELPVRLCNYSDVYHNDSIRSDMEFMRATASGQEIDRFRLAVGDVLITKDSESWDDIGVPSFVQSSSSDLICGYHLALLRPVCGTVTGRFLHLALSCPSVTNQLFIRANGVTRFGLSQTAIKSCLVPIPSLSEQMHITRFLDHATGQIDRYIRAKQKMIELLDEQKKAIIHNAVTGRIDVRTGKPYSAYKPSGVEWLGEVPEHWEVRRLRNVGKALIGITYSPDDVVDRGEGLLVLRASNIRGAKIVDADNVYVGCQVPGRLLTLEGDILLCSRSGSRTLVGKNAVIDARCAGVTFGAFMTVFRSSSNEFLRFAFNSALFDRQSGAFQTSTINQLTLSMLYSIRAPFPPPGEQSIIVRYLNDAIAKTIRASDRANHEIELLRIYRTRLIADVVTGKLDVREAAKALPDISPSVPSDQIEMFQASS